jgi:farnesyl-diphosphate farnesyltransferase
VTSFQSSLLREVSRSFYLTLRVLPASVRPQIGLAYLLARATDTIADTQLVPVEQRLRALQALRERVLGTSHAELEFGQLAQQQGSPSERVLLENCESVLGLLQNLSPADLALVRKVLSTITSGQELDLFWFAGASTEHVVALKTDAELEDYTFCVAGCVGPFWTRVCRAHVFPRARLDDAWLLARSERFGKGLQLVNILRDLPADLRQGRCYLPEEGLSQLGLKAHQLLDTTVEPKLRPLYDRWLDRAEEHLIAGWEYTNALPVSSVRVRLACAWPILIGIETIKLLRVGRILDHEKRIKVGRDRVRQLMIRSVVLYPVQRAWRRMVA